MTLTQANPPLKKRRNDLPFRRRLVLVLLSDPRSVILWQAMTFILMGAWLLNPDWHTFPSSGAYRIMWSLAEEQWWGLWFMDIGLALTWVSTDYRRRTLRLIILFLNCMSWFFVTVAFGLGNPAALGLPVFMSQALIASWSFIRM